MGRRVLVSTIMPLAALVMAFGANFYFVVMKIPPHSAPGLRVLLALAPLVPLLFIARHYLFRRPLDLPFSIDGGNLILGEESISLQGLTDVSRDPEVLRRAMRRFDGGRLGSIRGQFWSKRLGNFEAFLTDTENAVVLRWPDKVVAVSPADPEFFIHAARAAAGLR
jgi:PH (Pleckstrin Homology) domain-containing protein